MPTENARLPFEIDDTIDPTGHGPRAGPARNRAVPAVGGHPDD